MIQKRKENGFTLIEMLLAAAIALIGLSASTAILMQVYKNSHLLETADQVQQQTNIALEKVVKEFQETAVGTINPAPSDIMNTPGYPPVNTSDIISFASARDNNGNFVIDEYSGKPVWANAIVYFRGAYFIDEYPDLDPNTLYRYKEGWDTYNGEFDPSTSEQMATSVTDVKFWFYGNNLLNIKMTLALNPEAANPTEEEFITAVVIRN
ncbi:type II secretion system protein [Candidatus Poribacteria bacterium]|nr:type II secretion system protein [Candidatus Poribacteria bacterium]